MAFKKGDPATREAGRRGGKVGIERHGRERLSEIGKLGGASNVKNRGLEWLREIGRRGGIARAAKHPRCAMPPRPPESRDAVKLCHDERWLGLIISDVRREMDKQKWGYSDLARELRLYPNKVSYFLDGASGLTRSLFLGLQRLFPELAEEWIRQRDKIMDGGSVDE